MQNGTTILFRLPGVTVERFERVMSDDGGPVRLVHVVTAASSSAGCPQCGVVSTSVKQYRTTRPGDLPYGEERLEVRWHKRQSLCRDATCQRKAFTESIAEIPPWARLTGRPCQRAAAQVASGRSVSAAAVEYGMSWPVTHCHYAAHAGQLRTEPEPPVVLGSMRPAAPDRRDPGRFDRPVADRDYRGPRGRMNTAATGSSSGG